MLEMDPDSIGTVKVHMEQNEVEAGKAIISHAVERLFLDRLDDMRTVGQPVGWGVGDDFYWPWEQAGLAASK